MTQTTNWPTRQEWETRERNTAQWMIETGDSQQENDWPSFTREEQAEVADLLPTVVKQIRKACSQVERAARAQSPTAAELYGRKAPRFATMAEVEAWMAPVEALEGDDKAAHELLVTMRYIRSQVSGMTGYRPDPLDTSVHFRNWPADFPRPSSPEIDRMTALVDQASHRHRERNRDQGRRRLEALNAPDAWQKELDRRADIEDYFRRGPIR